MLEPGGDPLNDPLRLHLVRGLVPGEGVKNVDLAPLRALIQRRQELLQDGARDQGHVLPGRLLDLGERGHGVRHDRGVGVANQVPEHV